jgi:preprotein translocase subunit SecE
VSVVKEKKMASVDKPAASSSFVKNLLLTGIYKRRQGRIARQVTFFAIVGAISVGAWRLFTVLQGTTHVGVVAGVPAALVLIGGWLAYRLVNMPNFADFLIAVEAEMSKVSWPTRTELIRGSVVVLMTIIILAGLLFLYDLGWTFVFKALGIQS